jgi:asparagine synthase (glutamine-hydrolysing)
MCGWVIVIDSARQGLPEQALKAATRALRHRGPDDSGEFTEAGVQMGFVRLSILDLSAAGHQPMASADGRYVIVFNGEIYNYRELRVELEALGHRFASQSDTEVLLSTYIQWGPECLAKLNGMFAFAIYDRSTRSWFAARDRLGEKPFYVWRDDRWTVLASEPGAIASTGLMRLEPDWSRFADFAVFGLMDHEGGTLLRGVSQLPAGHCLQIDAAGAQHRRRYWEPPLPSLDDASRSDAQWVETLAALVGDAVKLRLRSDVPVGFTLSGGIDSSLLICEAAHQGNSTFDAFSFHDPLHDERSLVETTLAQTGARGHSLDAQALDIAARLPSVIAANGEPVQSWSAVANHALFELARQHGVKVVLGGQGADEAFAGYSSFETNRWTLMALSLRWPSLIGDVRRSARRHGAAASGLMLGVLARTFREAASRALSAVRPKRVRSLQPPINPYFSTDVVGSRRQHPLVAASAPRSLANHQAVTLTGSPLPLYLRVEDRVSMAHSVEARLPFVDHRLIEHGLRMPDHLKYDSGLNKVALRAVAAARVPPAVSNNARKFGFPVGLRASTATSLQTLCRELASTRAFRERGVYDMRSVERMLARPATLHDSGALFDLAQTELWLAGLEGQRR